MKRYNKISPFQTEKGKFAIIEAPCEANTSIPILDDMVMFGSIMKVNPYHDGDEYSYLLNFYHEGDFIGNRFIYNENVFAPAQAISFLSDLPSGYWGKYVSQIHSMDFTLEFLCINTARKNVLIKYTSNNDQTSHHT